MVSGFGKGASAYVGHKLIIIDLPPNFRPVAIRASAVLSRSPFLDHPVIDFFARLSRSPFLDHPTVDFFRWIAR
jgi:hypothetical protein